MHPIDNHLVAQHLGGYLDGRISLAHLVDWAESALMDGEIEPERADAVRQALAEIGLADVKEFGLSWETCERLLASLGYKAAVSLQSA